MDKLAKTPGPVKLTSGAEGTDYREQLFNGREVGPIERVQFPAVNITTLHAVLYDLDPGIFVPTMDGEQPGEFFERLLRPMLDRHPVLAAAEVRDSGRGWHVIPWFAEPVVFESDRDRRRWEGVVMVIQTALPVDPDQPGLTALTRPVDTCQWTRTLTKLLNPNSYEPEALSAGRFPPRSPWPAPRKRPRARPV